VDEGFEYELDPALEPARDAANAWLARFAPLVMDDQVPTEREVRDRLKIVDLLRQQGPQVRRGVRSQGDLNWELMTTLDRASEQLDSLELGLRRQLSLLAPGDPEGVADLERLNERLAVRSARQEIGLSGNREMPAVLELKTSPANFAQAVGIGVFGFGWTSFTTVHAIFMIGGFSQAFGWLALGLLGFYSIFFLVGFAMMSAAVNSACDESITLDGRTLTLRRTLGKWVREKRHSLAPNAKAEIGKVDAVKMGTGRSNAVTPALIVADADGRPISFGAGQTTEQRESLRDRINAYLRLTQDSQPS